MIPSSKNFGNSTTIQELWMPVFPARTTRKLRFYNSATVTASSTAGTHVISANGLFDPNVTGGTDQPMGFDQLMLSYNHYVVTHAKIIATATNSAALPSTASISVSATAAPTSVIRQIVEFGGNAMETLESKLVAGSARVLSASVDIRKIQGVKNVEDEDSLRGDASANPTEQTYFMLQGWNTQGVSGSVTFDFIVEYTAIFKEPRVLSVSLRSKIKQLIQIEALETKR